VGVKKGEKKEADEKIAAKDGKKQEKEREETRISKNTTKPEQSRIISQIILHDYKRSCARI
jgi:hypothetical protein